MMKIWIVSLLFATALGQRVNSTQGCGGSYQGTTGEITSPGFGVSNYPSDSTCTWIIRVPNGFIVRMQFISIDIEVETDCSYDGVIFYDTTEAGTPPSLSETERLLGGVSFCGDEAFNPVSSTTNLVGVHFYSDGSVQAAGFRLQWSASVQITGDQFNCTFEDGLCRGWRNIVQPDDHFDWQLRRSSTPSSGTGPTFDHTLKNRRGQYIFIETSFPREENETAILVSPQISFNEGNRKMCISFWYHMLGISVGRLIVTQRSGNNRRTLWERSGQQGPVWLQGLVEVDYASQPLQISFTGTRASEPYGDIALDDISITSGPCDRSPSPDTTFTPTTQPRSPISSFSRSTQPRSPTSTFNRTTQPRSSPFSGTAQPRSPISTSNRNVLSTTAPVTRPTISSSTLAFATVTTSVPDATTTSIRSSFNPDRSTAVNDVTSPSTRIIFGRTSTDEAKEITNTRENLATSTDMGSGQGRICFDHATAGIFWFLVGFVYCIWSY